MISIVRRLGAPVIEPQGYRAVKMSARSTPSRRRARTVEVICSTLLKRCDVEQGGSVDAAGDGDASQVVAQQVDDHQVFGAVFRVGRQRQRALRVDGRRRASAGAVPFMGRASSSPWAWRTNSSGDSDSTARPSGRAIRAP